MNTLPPPSRERVQQGLNALHLETGMAPQPQNGAIVPLGEFIGATNLTCVEVAGLTMHTALRHLAQERILPDIDLGYSAHDPLAGFLYATDHYGTIFSNQNDLVVRRRFTVAHELGHYLMHVQPALPQMQAQGLPEVYEYLPLYDAPDDEAEPATAEDAMGGHLHLVGGTTELPWSTALVEREADAFAAEVLMPQMMVRLLFERYRTMVNDIDIVWRLASEMLVSRAAMRRRLHDLGLLNTTTQR